MGGKKSKFISGATDEDINFLRTRLNLSAGEVGKLRKAFKKFDLEKDGRVEYDEFCARLRVEPTPLLHTLFTFFGPERQQERSNPALNFAEFSLFVTHFLTLNERHLVEFLFTLLTCDHSDRAPASTVPLKRLEDAMQALLSVSDRRKITQFVGKMGEHNRGHIDVNKKHFVDAVMTHSKSIAFPFVAYQLDMTKKVAGRTFWGGRPNVTHNTVLALRYELQCLLEKEAEVATPAAESEDITLDNNDYA